MIEIQLTTALALYSGLIGLLAVGIWAYTELSVRRPQQRMGQQFLWRCVICGCTYLDERADRLSECPRCGSLNSVGDRGAPPNLSAAVMEMPEPDGDASRGGSKRKRHGGRRGPRKRR